MCSGRVTPLIFGRLVERQFARTLLLTAIKKTVLLRPLIVLPVQLIGNKKDQLNKAFFMKFFVHLVGLTAALFFCVAASSEPVDNPHQQSLAAVRAGNLPRLQELVEQHGANLNSRNRIGESLLVMAIKGGKSDIANWLLDRGANVQINSTAKVTPLMVAAFNGDLTMVNRLLSLGIDVHAADQQKKTAIVYAAANGHTDVVARLLKAGVDINARYPNELTVLMWAAGQGHDKTVRFLLEAGADNTLKDNRGKTAVEIADEGGHLAVKKILSGES